MSQAARVSCEYLPSISRVPRGSSISQGELFGGERVLLKEYLSCAREIGENELAMYGLLCDGGKETPPQLGSLLGSRLR